MGMPGQEHMSNWENMLMPLRFNKYKMCLHLKACANTHDLQWSIYEYLD